MSLNIKNERVCDLARQAAEVTGQTQVSAVEQALVRLLRDYGHDPQQVAAQRRIDLVHRIAAEYRSDPGVQGREINCVEDLYDEVGLPK